MLNLWNNQMSLKIRMTFLWRKMKVKYSYKGLQQRSKTEIKVLLKLKPKNKELFLLLQNPLNFWINLKRNQVKMPKVLWIQEKLALVAFNSNLKKNNTILGVQLLHTFPMLILLKMNGKQIVAGENKTHLIMAIQNNIKNPNHIYSILLRITIWLPLFI